MGGTVADLSPTTATTTVVGGTLVVVGVVRCETAVGGTVAEDTVAGVQVQINRRVVVAVADEGT